MKHVPSFLTAVCYDFKMLLAEEKHKLIVINSLKYLVNNGQIVIYGYVIMRYAARSNHIHIIWHAISDKTNEQLQRSLLKFTAHTNDNGVTNLCEKLFCK